MHNDVNTLFNKLWDKYVSITPSAPKIRTLLGFGEVDNLFNDHIALRTFDIQRIGLDKLAEHFKTLGYYEAGEYHFKEKKLFAKHFLHADTSLPKVFISELLTTEFSTQLQGIINNLVSQISDESVVAKDFLYSGRHWDIDYSTYQTLLQESEYAAWVAAWGFLPNHFTLSCNHLNKFSSLQALNSAVKDHGFELNTAGGEIKGTEALYLEQSSTLADFSAVSFTDGAKLIPSCFYEFAQRYPDKDKNLFTGFVAASADKIFESTDQR